jgi:rare lipoprotein A
MWGCSSHQPKADLDRPGYTETGKASFYADKHQLKKTASGEIYDHNLSTAAHRTLPFGAKVKVTNIENGKSVIVKINDRGPFVKGRIIDLSRSAFNSIANRSSGVIEVQIELIN